MCNTYTLILNMNKGNPQYMLLKYEYDSTPVVKIIINS